MAQQNGTVAKYLPRLIASWAIVGVPLIYGIVQAVLATVPLFLN